MGFTEQRFTVNLSILFTELPLLERPAAARAAGFTAVELWWPWPDTPTPARAEIDSLRHAIEDAGVRLTGLNFYAGQLPGPDRGALSLPGRSPSGSAPTSRWPPISPSRSAAARSTLCTATASRAWTRRSRTRWRWRTWCSRPGPRAASARSSSSRRSNKPESPRYPLVSAPAAVEVVDRVNEVTGLGNARFLMDLYHLSMNGEDLPSVIQRYADRTGHVQIADSPGRGTPGTGSLPLEELLGLLTKAGYEGWVGLEYKPGDRPSAEAFEWLPREARRAP